MPVVMLICCFTRKYIYVAHYFFYNAGYALQMSDNEIMTLYNTYVKQACFKLSSEVIELVFGPSVY